MGLEKYEAKMVFASSQTISITEDAGGSPASATVTVAAADTAYYWSTLLSTIGTALTNNATLANTYTLTLDDDSDGSLGKITIARSAGTKTFRITAISASLKAYLGADGDTYPTADVTTYTFGYAARFLWLPPSTRSETLGPKPTATSSRLGHAFTDGTLTHSPTGVIQAHTYSTGRQMDLFAYANVIGHRTRIDLESGIVTNASLERFWLDALYNMTPLRYFPERSNDSIYLPTRVDARTFDPHPHNPAWVGAYAHYHVRWPMWVDV